MISASRGTVYIMAAQVVFVLLGFALNAFLARALGVENFGVVGLVTTFALVVLTLMSAGFNGATTKYAAQFPQSAGFIDKYCTKVLLVATIAFTLLVLIFAEFLANLFGNIALAYPLRVAALIIPFQSLYTQRLAVSVAVKDFDKMALATVSLAVSKLLIAVALVMNGFAVIGAIIGQVVAPLFAFFVLGKKVSLNGTKYKVKFDIAKLWKYALEYTAGASGTWLVQSLDIFLVQALVNNPLTTGLYIAASTISRAMVTIIGVVAVGVFPYISKLNNVKTTTAQNYIKVSFLFLLSLLVPICFFMYAGAYNLIAIIMSEQYASATIYLQVLSLSAAFITLVFVSHAMLNAAGKTKETMFLAFTMILLDVIAIFIFATNYGAIGAAYGVLVATFISLLLTFYLLNQTFGAIVNVVPVAKLIIAGVIATIPIFLIQSILLTKWSLIPAFAIGGICYIVLLVLLRVYKNEDVKLVNSFIPKVFLPWFITIERLVGY